MGNWGYSPYKWSYYKPYLETVGAHLLGIQFQKGFYGNCQGKHPADLSYHLNRFVLVGYQLLLVLQVFNIV